MSNPHQPTSPPTDHPARPITRRVFPRRGHSVSSPTQPTDWLIIGRIVAPFGIRGEMKLHPETDFPERIAHHPILYLGANHVPYHPLMARQHGKQIVLSLREVTDVNMAETLRDQEVMIPANEAAPLGPDQFYIHQLIGLRVVHINGTMLGEIKDVFQGAQDLLAVRRPGLPDVLVPLVKALVPSVDIAGGFVTVDPPEGLFEGESIEIQETAEPSDEEED
jgi:16S rRNA processing protein RimM